MPRPESRTEDQPLLFRIGEVAKLTGLTTRTLRYWEQLGLVSPSDYSDGGERRYSRSDMARAGRIRDLQELLGFSLAEVRVVLDTDDIAVLDRVRSELQSDDLPAARHRALLDEALAANEQLLTRLDETVSRLQAFRAERVASAERMRARREELGGAPSRHGHTRTV